MSRKISGFFLAFIIIGLAACDEQTVDTASVSPDVPVQVTQESVYAWCVDEGMKGQEVDSNSSAPTAQRTSMESYCKCSEEIIVTAYSSGTPDELVNKARQDKDIQSKITEKCLPILQ